VSEPRIYPDPPEPDAVAKGVRAVFGGLLGLLLAVGLWLRLGGLGLWETLLLATFAVGFCKCVRPEFARYGPAFEHLNARLSNQRNAAGSQ
jgi:hypothetical protein